MEIDFKKNLNSNNFFIHRHESGVKREMTLLQKIVKSKFNMKKMYGEFNSGVDLVWLKKYEKLLKKDNDIIDLTKNAVDQHNEFITEIKKHYENDNVCFFVAFDENRKDAIHIKDYWVYGYSLSNNQAEHMKILLCDILCDFHKDVDVEKLTDEELIVLNYKSKEELLNLLYSIAYNYKYLSVNDVISIFHEIEMMMLKHSFKVETKEETKSEISREMEELSDRFDSEDSYA